MEQLDSYRARQVLVGFIGAILLYGCGSARADFTFGTPTNMGPTINTSDQCGHPSISSDGLSLYFTSLRPGGSGGYGDTWVTTRETVLDPWGTPVCLGPVVNSPSRDTSPEISPDGLSLYFSSDRPGDLGGTDIWVTTRETTSDPWNPPVNVVQPVNSSHDEQSPSISSNGFSMYFMSNRSGGGDLYVAMRDSILSDWSTSLNLGATVNSPSYYDHAPDISADGLCLFFSSDRPGGYGNRDLWVTTRATENDPWREPLNLGPVVNSAAHETTPDISADGSALYFCSDRSGGFGSLDLWEVEILPVVDLNGDGIVDSADICIMVDHWGENYSLCDVGPTPLGDGIVDVQDLIILTEHLFEDVSDPTLIAHWPLDEAEGMVITDRAGDNDGYALGNPVWQPDGGQVNGALQLDGVDDYVVTGAAPIPEVAAYSVLAWTKGGAPGQVVLSQMGKANWLMADASDGKLITELVPPAGRTVPTPLVSEFVITDGNWHRIGFVWDGSYRRLYVDGLVVAEDLQDNLDISINGLYLGAGKAMEPGTFWSGLIDDVRIYNRAVRP